MTQAQYARRRNRSPQCISNLAKRGVLVMRGRLVDLQASDAGPGVVRPRAQCTGLARCVSGPRLAPKRHANLPTPFPSTRNGLFSRFPTPGCGIAAGIQAHCHAQRYRCTLSTVGTRRNNRRKPQRVLSAVGVAV
jgi:hypothetical protein